MVLAIVGLWFSSAQAVTIDLKVLDSDITVGENFDIEVWVDGEDIGEDLLSFGFDVFVGGTAFSYLSYNIESGFEDFSFPPNSNNVSGSGISFSDDVLLATLSFQTNIAGNGLLSVSGPYDEDFYGLFYEENCFSISAQSTIFINEAGPSAVPVPAPILLLGTGLIGMPWVRKRMK